MISTPGNLTNGNTASLTLRDNDRSAYASLSPTRLVNTSRLWLTGHVDFFGEADLFESFAQHATAGVACKRNADGLGHKRHGAGGARVHFNHVEFAILDGELHVHETTNVEFLREFLGVLADLFLDFLGEGHRRDDAGGVAGVDACGFHVFHDGADNGVLAVADAVHVEFGGVFEEAVDKNRLAFANGGGFFHELAEVFFLVDNHHAAATENEARAHENGVADFLDDGEGFFHVVGDAFSFRRSRT